MKKYFIAALLACFMGLIAACGTSSTPQTTPSAENRFLPAIESRSTPVNIQPTASQEQSYPVNTPISEGAYPPAPESREASAAYPQPSTASFTPYAPGTTTGVEAVDRVLMAFTGGDLSSRQNLIRFLAAPCAREQGVTPLPRCAANESEATLVEGLPVLGPEGTFLRRSEMPADFFAGDFQLVAVYEVKPEALQETYTPSGQFGIVLAQSRDPGSVTFTTLRINESGIVRVDIDRDRPASGFCRCRGFSATPSALNRLRRVYGRCFGFSPRFHRRSGSPPERTRRMPSLFPWPAPPPTFGSSPPGPSLPSGFYAPAGLRSLFRSFLRY